MTIIKNDIDAAATLLKNDQVIAIPTETVYGLAGNALSVSAVTKIDEIKNATGKKRKNLSRNG